MLSVGRGEKLSVSAGGGLTAKGRAKYNAATGSKLKAPTTATARLCRVDRPKRHAVGHGLDPLGLHARLDVALPAKIGVGRRSHADTPVASAAVVAATQTALT